jgi:hypothetical protein
MFGRLHVPSLDGATEWLNSEPLGPAELRGHVVVVNFSTWTCINWLRQEPYVRAWSQAYRDDGLVVIGVHTPEFSFEHDIDGVRRATHERAIDYPVGIIRDDHFGEGRYEQSERVIQRLLGVERDRRRGGRGGGGRLGPAAYARDLSRLRARRALFVTRRSRT